MIVLPAPSLLCPPVLAELQQSKLVASEECSMLSHIVDVVSVQITKSPEVMTETAAVLRRHELGKESKLLSGKSLSLLAAA